VEASRVSWITLVDWSAKVTEGPSTVFWTMRTRFAERKSSASLYAKSNIEPTKMIIKIRGTYTDADRHEGRDRNANCQLYARHNTGEPNWDVTFRSGKRSHRVFPIGDNHNGKHSARVVRDKSSRWCIGGMIKAWMPFGSEISRVSAIRAE
jgi:hypothetical protein